MKLAEEETRGWESFTINDLTSAAERSLQLRVWGNAKEAFWCWPSHNKHVYLQFLSCQGSQFRALADVMLIKTNQLAERPLRAAFVCFLSTSKPMHCNLPCTCLHQQKPVNCYGCAAGVIALASFNDTIRGERKRRILRGITTSWSL